MRPEAAPTEASPAQRSAAAPFLAGDAGVRASRAIALSLRILLVILPLLLIASYLVRPPVEVVVLTGLLIAVIGLYRIQTAGHTLATISGLVVILVIFGFISLATYGSIRGLGALAFIGAVVVGGIFLGRTALIGVVLVSVAALGVITYAENTGILGAPPDFSVGLFHWATYSAAIVAIALNVFYSRALALEALRHARASQERLAKLFRSNPAALLITRVDDGRVIDMNPAYGRVFGIAREEAIGETAISLKLWTDLSERARFLERVRAEGRVENMPATMQRRDSAAFEALISAELLEVGDTPQILTTVTDISEMVRARAALRTSEERFASAFRLNPIGMAITRLSDGRYIDLSEIYPNALGYTRAESIGRTAEELGIWVTTADRDRFRAKLLADGQVSAFAAPMRNKAGEVIDCQIWAALTDLDGEACVLSSTLDVTAQIREQTLILDIARGVSGETGEPFFRSLVEHLGRALQADTVIVGEKLDDDRVRTLAMLRDASIVPNISYALTGTPSESIFARPDLTLYSDRVAELFPRDPVLARDRMRGYVGLALRDTEGESIGVLIVVSRRPIEPSERNEALFRIFAARAQAELLHMRGNREILALNETLESRVNDRTAQLEAANRELEAFSYSVSHDLKAPLRAIDGFVRVLTGEQGAADPALRAKAQERVVAAVTRMNNLIDDMIGLAQVSRQEIFHEHVDLSTLAREVAEAQREHAPAHAVDLRVAPSATIRCDRALMRIVLENLIGNAWKFTGRRADARVEFGTEVQSDGETAFYVRDNGAGFDPEYADRLFAPFQRLHSEREFAGTGIGLATVQRIVARHGGRVWAKSEPEKGACFYFTCETA